MFTRIMTGVIGIPIILCVVFLVPGWGFSSLIAIVCALIQIELLWNTRILRKKTAVAAACILAAGIPLLCWFGADAWIIVAGILVLTVILFGMAMSGNLRFDGIAPVYFSALVVPIMLSSFVAILKAENGIYLVLYPMAAAWMSDTGGYFFGRWFGKRKLCPKISPKKTVEGSVGGLVFSAAASAVYCAVLRFGFGAEPRWAVICVLGVVCSGAAQFGDLMFSFIKRERGIKDYGKIIPGHGGLLDRCDSIMLAAALVWIATKIIPLVTV